MDFDVPRHVALVLDGNRRYAKKLGLPPWKGHEYGLRKLEELFKWCMELGVKELTLYCFSTENFRRTKQEVDYLFNLFWHEFNKMEEGKGVFKNKVKVNVIGRIYMFPKKMQKAMLEVMQKTRKNNKLAVNFALAYGGRQEIVDAFKKILRSSKRLNPDKIDENLITKNLYLQSEPDILIRPGGEIRTSNFLTWQSIYSEWFFVNKLWPEFTKQDLMNCIEEFNERGRRFGR
ncbi:di-trans,poly-cis-decaprenylcistransferase [Candidatus Woesearchaeota archaeon]|nr:di-trans,poly-cis-decaprenylcistransferase [Candidatus Woesearchaeota archaeon]